MTLGSRIKERRISCGFTQAQMADKSDMTEANFSSYERDKSVPSLDKLQKIAELFNVSTDYLLYGFDKVSFTQQVNMIRGKRSIEEFSQFTGINEEELLNICRGLISEQPSLNTVEKLSRHNEYDIIFGPGSLYKAAGYLDIYEGIKSEVFNAARKDWGNELLTPEEQKALDQYKQHLRTNLVLDESVKGYLYEEEFRLVARFRKLSPVSQQTVLALIDNLEILDKTQKEQSSSKVG